MTLSKISTTLIVTLPALALLLPACKPTDPNAEDDEVSGDGDGDGDADADADADDGPVVICMPGQTQCASENEIETCAATGLIWESSFCDAHQTCQECAEGEENCEGAVCKGPCEITDDLPSSAGCSFFATGMLHSSAIADDGIGDAMVVGNPNSDPNDIATVQMTVTPENSNIPEAVGPPVELAPGETHVFVFDPELTDFGSNGSGTSLYRTGGVYHLSSDLPVIAYLHSPYQQASTNESSLLLPEISLRQDYVVATTYPYAEPSYFVVVATQDDTTLRWYPTIETAGDNFTMPFVEGGAVGELHLNRFDNVRVAASQKLGLAECYQDLSGTIVEADKPISVVSAVLGARVPYCATQSNGSTEACIPPMGPYEVNGECYGTTDHVQEQNIPLDYWGDVYVGAHSPLRATEEHYWRLFAASDEGTTSIHVDPPQPGVPDPIELSGRGDWLEIVIPNDTSVVFSSDDNKAFMPVQYTTNHNVAGDIGDPAMTQAIPVEQYLSRYAFVTGLEYTYHYVQVIREAGNSEVMLDGVAVTGYYSVGDYEVMDVLIEEGAHEIISDDAFGIVQYGYTEGNAPAAYAYPGGMKVEPIFIP